MASTVLYAEHEGPPLWVRIWQASDSAGTMVELTGAVWRRIRPQGSQTEPGVKTGSSESVGVQHVHEAQPPRIEVQVHEPGRPVPVLGRRSARSRPPRPGPGGTSLPDKSSAHIGILLDGTEAARDRPASGGGRDGRRGAAGAGPITSTARSRSTASALSARTARATRSSSRAAGARRGGELERIDHQQLAPGDHVERPIATSSKSAPSSGRTSSGACRSRSAAAPTAARAASSSRPCRRSSTEARPSIASARSSTPLGTHLPREVQRGYLRGRGPDRDAQSQRRLPAADIAGQHHQILAPQSARQHPIERGKAGGTVSAARRRPTADRSGRPAFPASSPSRGRRVSVGRGMAEYKLSPLICGFACAQPAAWRPRALSRFGPPVSRAGATSWLSTWAAVSGLTSRSWLTAAASARRSGGGMVRLESRCSRACTRRRWARSGRRRVHAAGPGRPAP